MTKYQNVKYGSMLAVPLLMLALLTSMFGAFGLFLGAAFVAYWTKYLEGMSREEEMTRAPTMQKVFEQSVWIVAFKLFLFWLVGSIAGCWTWGPLVAASIAFLVVWYFRGGREEIVKRTTGTATSPPPAASE